jgi:two-component system KDP operon response regulator KdpE
MKVLIVEDDSTIVEAISLAFHIGWPDADIIHTQLGEEGVDLAESESPNIVILDLGLPDISGFEVLKRIRLFSSVPVVVLTVRADEQDVIKALDLGADDYVTKPFRQLELLARIKASIRRQHLPENEICIDSGQFKFYMSSHKIQHGTETIRLTSTEALILFQLLSNKGRVVTYGALSERIWGTDYYGAIESIRAHIRNLRQKIDSAHGNSSLIINKPGLGYMFSQQD